MRLFSITNALFDRAHTEAYRHVQFPTSYADLTTTQLYTTNQQLCHFPASRHLLQIRQSQVNQMSDNLLFSLQNKQTLLSHNDSDDGPTTVPVQVLQVTSSNI